MGYSNPPIPWSKLEQKLSGTARPSERLCTEAKFSKDGGDSPAWSQHRGPYVPPVEELPSRPAGPVTPYAELHCHSNFSFLDGPVLRATSFPRPTGARACRGQQM